MITDIDESKGSFFHRTSFRNGSKKTTTSRPNHNRSFSAQSKPTTSSSIKPVGPPGTNPTTFEKVAGKPVPEITVLHTSRVWTLCKSVPGQTKTPLEVNIEDEEKDLRFERFCKDREISGCIRTLASTDLTPNYDRAHLRVVRCTLPQPEQVNDWRTTTFHTFTKIGDRTVS